MTLRYIPKEGLLSVLAGKDVTRLTECVDALLTDPQESFAMAESPANILRQSLEIKYNIAREHGSRFEGDVELLNALSALGDRVVTAVSTEQNNKHFLVFLTTEPLEPFAAVIMYRGA